MRYSILFLLFSIFSINQLHSLGFVTAISGAQNSASNKVQEALDRANVSRGMTHGQQQKALERKLEKISLAWSCAEKCIETVWDGNRFVVVETNRSAGNIIKNFCCHPGVKSRIELTIDWTSPEGAIGTLDRLHNKIHRDSGSHQFRKEPNY